jgi:hypothetical protein
MPPFFRSLGRERSMTAVDFMTNHQTEHGSENKYHERNN